MSTDRARQKKLEKHKKKRAEAKRGKTGLTLPTTIAGLVREATTRPFGPCWVASDVHDVDAAVPHLVHVVVTRRLPGGALIAAIALVDRACFGLKNGFVTRPMGEAELEAVMAQLSERQKLEPCDVLFAQSVVFHAIDFAKELGFPPHRDFPLGMLGARPAVLLDTPLARHARPFYEAGPGDDVAAVRARLDAAIGEGGYDFLAADEGAVDFAAIAGEDGGEGGADEDGPGDVTG